MLRSPILALAAATMLALFAACSAPRVELTPEYAQLKLEGHYGASSMSVTSTNSLSDLGLDEKETHLGGRLDLQWGSPHITISTLSGSFAGTGTLTSDVMHDGSTITVGSDVETQMELAASQAVVTFDFIPSDMFEAGLGLGAGYLDIEGQIVDTMTSTKIESDQAAPIPLIALRAGVELGRFTLSGLASGMQIDSQGDHAQYRDIDVQLRFRLIGERDALCGFLAAGWRDVRVQLEYEDGGDHVDAEAEMSGPYVGLTISF